MPTSPWYEQPLSLSNMEELFRFWGMNFPMPLKILSRLREGGRKTCSLREWLKDGGVDPRGKYRENFVDWLAKLAECKNDLLGVEPFDVEAAKKPLKESGKILITIYSSAYLKAFAKYAAVKAKNAKYYAGKESNRNRGKGERSANLQEECGKDDANIQEENEDSCGKGGCFSPLNGCTDKNRDSLSFRERESKENAYEELLNYYGES